MYKPLRKRRMSKYSGPLGKLIDQAAEKKMSSLKLTTEDVDMADTAANEYKEEYQPTWGDWQVSKVEDIKRKGKEGTLTTEQRTGVIPGQKDDYEGPLAPDDAWSEWLQTEDGIAYTKKHSDQEVTEEREKFVTNFENISPLPPREIQPDKPMMQPVKRKAGEVSLGEFMKVNPESAMTDSASDFFNTSFSTDNPKLKVLNDDKFMRKARKAYEKTNPSSRKRLSMPFQRWVMQTYKPKGMDGTIIDMARDWEGDNATDTDSSGEGGAVDRDVRGARDTAEARYSADPGDWRSKRTGSERDRPATQFKSQSHMIKNLGKKMSFKNQTSNTGFKMKRR